MSVLRHFERWIKLVIEEKIDWHCRIIVVEICYSALFFLTKRQARLHRTEQFCIGIALLNTRSLFQSFTPDLASISILVISVSSCQRISKPNTYLSSGRSLNPRGSSPPIGLTICLRASTSSSENRQNPINIMLFIICILFALDVFQWFFMINKHMNKHITCAASLRHC